MASLPRIMAVASVETRRLLRDRTSFSLIVLVPVLQIILFGLTVNLDPRNVPVAIAGGSPSSQERVVELIETTRYFGEPVVEIEPGAALLLLEQGLVKLAIELPDDTQFFEEQTVYKAGDTSNIRVYIDGADAGAVAPAAAALEHAVLKQVAVRATEGAGQPELLAKLEALETEWLYNPDQQTSWTIMPGLIGVIVMISMLMLGALTLAREREQGTWEMLLVLPVDAADVLLGKLLPYVAIAFIQILLSTTAAVSILGVPLAGGPLILGFAALLLAFAHLTLGLTLSALVANQMQALQGAVAFYLPSMLLSGFMFPFSGMPKWAQVIGELLPLTHFVRIARDVMLRGTTEHSATDMIGIALFAMGFAVVALFVFRARLD